ncbi:MAG: hypothetical protein HYW47_04055 [Deltaproteobacteria bacterium]|nr:hypothetical protein [Deltaproteobacteria bacterium]
MTQKRKIHLLLTSKELIFSFFLLISVSLIVFGIGFYIGVGVKKENPQTLEAKIEQSSPPPMIEPLVPVKIEPEPLEKVEEPKEQTKEPIIIPQELPKETIAQKENLQTTEPINLFVSEENLKTLSEVLKHGPFTLKLGTFAKVEAVLHEKEKIHEAGFPSAYFCPQEDPSTLTLCLGGFSTEKKAENFATLLKKKKIIETFNIHKLN